MNLEKNTGNNNTFNNSDNVIGRYSVGSLHASYAVHEIKS